MPGINWDDIVANPITSLPEVISSAKEGFVGKEEGEEPPPFEMEQDSVQQDSVQHDVHGDDGDNEDDSDFNDSDYDSEGDDDHIFVDYVDCHRVDWQQRAAER
jgi:hypothetical protein